MASKRVNKVRRLLVILGDQLGDCASRLLNDFDGRQDRVWMAEVPEESTHVWSHKARITLFLSAMRHFRDGLRSLGVPVVYRALDTHRHRTLATLLAEDLHRYQPESVVLIRAGDLRVQRAIEQAVSAAGLRLEVHEDPTFFIDPDAFGRWLDGRKQPRLEHFYRWMRKQTGYLMQGNQPLGGQWNFDASNRRSFGRSGPGRLPQPPAFPPDPVTRDVMALVQKNYPDHPGSLDSFDWPVTPQEARIALDDFLHYRLALFGPFEDAMWTDEPFLYHSTLSAALNLKLLDPRDVLDGAIQAWKTGAVPLESVEGFVRQILGWREYVRGIYLARMPGYLEQNALNAQQPLPAFFWTGETDMQCLQQVISQTLEYGYAHHIQRLMVTGLFCLLLGVRPREVHAWYLAVYVDAVEWVELPNTLGMSQYADGGWLASKPYVASGRYIKRMSNYCDTCCYDPTQATGEKACPFTTLYWDFLDRHRERFAGHPRTALQWKHLDRLDDEALQAIRQRAGQIRENCVTCERITAAQLAPAEPGW